MRIRLRRLALGDGRRSCISKHWLSTCCIDKRKGAGLDSREIEKSGRERRSSIYNAYSLDPHVNSDVLNTRGLADHTP